MKSPLPTVAVFNPRGPRREWCLFGTDQDVPEEMVVRHGWRDQKLVCAEISVRGGHTGPVEVLPYVAGDVFTYHPWVAGALFGNRFHPSIQIDGDKGFFEPRQTLLQHSRVIGTHWTARTRHGYAHLFTYFFSGQPGVPFELVVCAESLATPALSIWAGPMILFDCGNDGSSYRAALHNVTSFDQGLTFDLLDPFTASIGDKQGIWRHGMFTFAGDPADARPWDPETILAQQTWPLLPVGQWSKWGPWQATPTTKPLESWWAGQMQRRQPKTSPSGPGTDYEDPFAHHGLINEKNAGDTGDQDGFGTWQHPETVSGGGDARLALYERWALFQHAARPIWAHEQDGSIVRARNHPEHRCWSQITHFDHAVSPDRLGRLHDGSHGAPSHGWNGLDRGHRGSLWLAEDFILHGSLAAWFLLEHEAEILLQELSLPMRPIEAKRNFVPPTADPGTGRMVGRVALQLAYNVIATGNMGLLARGKEWVSSVLYPHFKAKEDFHGYIVERDRSPFPFWTHKGPDDLRYLPGKNSMVPWHDALLVWPADALRILLEQEKLQPQADQLEEILERVGGTVARLGYTPDGQLPINAISLDHSTTAPPDYGDAGQVSIARGTDFVHWMLPAVTLTKGRDGAPVDLIDRCLEIEALHWPSQHNVYKGVTP